MGAMKGKNSKDPIYLKLFASGPSKADLARIKIMEAAIRRLTTVGIENTSFDSIAQELGTTSSHLVYYFPSKDALLEAVMKFITATAHEAVSDFMRRAESPADMLSTYVSANFHWLREYPAHARVFMLLIYYASFKKNYAQLLTTIREAGAMRIAAMLAPASLRSATNSDAKSLQTAQAIQRLITGCMVDAIGPGSQEIEKQAIEAAHQLAGVR